MDNGKQKVRLLTYSELLEKLSTDSPSHLLLGNGFNNSLGVKTNYSEIFAQMKRTYSGYEQVESYLKGEYFDIEKLIGYLKGQINHDNEDFLPSYIERKVKLDFMNATNEIIQESIKNVYQDNNESIHLLLKNFTNYFTLNYDPFLYLLLMKFKKDDEIKNEVLTIQNTFLFQEEDLNQAQNNIYKKIKQAKTNGKLTINVNNNNKTVDLKSVKKTQFVLSVKTYFQDEAWKGKDIEKVCNQIWKEEAKQSKLKVDDGFRGEQLKLYQETEEQNLYFLHGAFHIVKNKTDIQKIIAKQNKSFIQKLEKAIHSESKDIVCILTNNSEEKKVQIEENKYLEKCFDALSKIDGALVILGSSLAENDNHIFEQINKSFISKVYISSCEETHTKDLNRAKDVFPKKKIILFDYKTISYREENQK